MLDTIGLVIPSVDEQLRTQADYLKEYRSIGILSSRTGAAGQINAIDEAVKRTNTEVLTIQLPGYQGMGAATETTLCSVRPMKPTPGRQLRLHWNILSAIPASCISVEKGMWS